TAVIVAIFAALIHYWPTSAELQQSVQEEYPVGVVSHLRSHPTATPMLNFYLWGGYLGWNDNNVKVFVDSRVDIFEYAGVLKDYLDLLGVKAAKPVLQKYGIQCILFPPDEPLTAVLEHDPEWRVVYRDDISVLFQRANPNTEAAGKEHQDLLENGGQKSVKGAGTRCYR